MLVYNRVRINVPMFNFYRDTFVFPSSFHNLNLFRFKVFEIKIVSGSFVNVNQSVCVCVCKLCLELRHSNFGMSK